MAAFRRLKRRALFFRQRCSSERKDKPRTLPGCGFRMQLAVHAFGQQAADRQAEAVAVRPRGKAARKDARQRIRFIPQPLSASSMRRMPLLPLSVTQKLPPCGMAWTALSSRLI